MTYQKPMLQSQPALKAVQNLTKDSHSIDTAVPPFTHTSNNAYDADE